MEVLTADSLSTAIRNSAGYLHLSIDESGYLAEHILNFFGYSGALNTSGFVRFPVSPATPVTRRRSPTSSGEACVSDGYRGLPQCIGTGGTLSKGR